MSRVHALLRRCNHEAGYTITELVAVMGILVLILTSLTGLFVSGTRAEIDLNERFQAQLNARLALDQLRREVHCASAITPAGSAATITMTLPATCLAGTGSITWCTVGSGSRYALYRSTSDPCDASGKPYADFLTSGSVFDHTVQSTASLGQLAVTLPVDLDPASATRRYELQDTLVMRNTLRTCVPDSPSPPC